MWSLIKELFAIIVGIAVVFGLPALFIWLFKAPGEYAHDNEETTDPYLKDG